MTGLSGLPSGGFGGDNSRCECKSGGVKWCRAITPDASFDVLGSRAPESPGRRLSKGEREKTQKGKPIIISFSGKCKYS